MLAIALMLFAIGAIPLVLGMSQICLLAFRESLMWRALFGVALALFGAMFLIEDGILRLIVGLIGMLIPLAMGAVFSIRYWDDTFRPFLLWLGGSFWYFSGVLVLFLRYYFEQQSRMI